MEGRHEGRQEGVIEALEIRFGELPDELTTAISEVQDIEHLKHLHREAIHCAGLHLSANRPSPGKVLVRAKKFMTRT